MSTTTLHSLSGHSAPRIGSLSNMLRRWARAVRIERSRADEAADVRQLARRVQHSDPGFASDLLAAADRHEHATERA